ncbi:hypothetical protein Tco_1381428 [Tanacetum coccineum]
MFEEFRERLQAANINFTSSDDESLSDEDVPEDKVKIYSNPLFEFDDEYISSNVNPLFDEVSEDIENKDSYVSNLDKSALLVTPLSDSSGISSEWNFHVLQCLSKHLGRKSDGDFLFHMF